MGYVMNDLKIFSGRSNPSLTARICEYVGIPQGHLGLTSFPDSEISCKLEENVRGRDVYLVQSTCSPVNEHLMELLVMIDTCKRASAERVTAVIPYFGYARQDRKDEGRVPITAKLVANLIERSGADRVLTMDLHAAQIQGFFDLPVDHLYAAPVLNEKVAEAGAKEIYVATTHGILCGNAISNLERAPIKKVILTDTIQLAPERKLPKMTILSVAPLLGEAIKRIHRNESVSRLFT
jgi:phosphoribosylpyrophosphate synthetase